MPARVALILCMIFIVCILLLDRKDKIKISVALWVPTLWMMITGSRMVSRWFYSEVETDSLDGYLAGSSFDRNIFLVLIFIGLLILFSRKLNWSNFIRDNIVIIVFLYFCALSILWSEFPQVAFKRWIKAIGNLVMVLIILSEVDSIGAIKKIIRRCAYLLLPLSIVLIKYFPLLGRKYHPYSGELTVTGVTTNKNALGSLCLVCGIFLLWEIISTRTTKHTFKQLKVYIDIVILILAIWLLIIANSATALVCFIFGVLFLLWLRMSDVSKRPQYVGAYILFPALIVISFVLLFEIPQVLLSSLGRDPTFTGRTDVWWDCIKLSGNPVVGTGYESFWLGERMQQLWDIYWWRPTESHNGFLETYLELGFIGLFLLLGILTKSFRKAGRELFINFDFASLQITLLFIVIIYNFMEAAFKGLHLMWFVLLIITVDYTTWTKNDIFSNFG